MKKGNLIALAVILIGVTAFFYFKNQDRTTTLNVQADFFQVKDTQSITKIFIADIEGNAATLEKKGIYWWVNNKYRVNQNSMVNLFEPLVKMRIKAPVTDNDKNDLVKELSVAGKKVEVYRNGQKERTLFIGNATADGLGTYIYSDDDGLDRPYIVHIPGWNGNLSPRFFFDEMAWRSKKVFHYQATQFSSITVDYVNEIQNSFEIKNEGKGKVNVYPVNPGQDSIKIVKEQKIKQLFVNSSQLYFEDFVKAAAKGKKDTVYNVLPTFCNIKVEVPNKPTKELVLKVVPTNDQKQLTPGRINQDRFYAYFKGEDKPEIGILQAQMAAKLLQKYDRFENSN